MPNQPPPRSHEARVAQWRRAVAAIKPPTDYKRARRVDRAINDDGTLQLTYATGPLPAGNAPVADASSISIGLADVISNSANLEQRITDHANAIAGVQGFATHVRDLLSWYVAGTLVVTTNVGAEFRVTQAATLERVDARVKTAPTGSAVTVQVAKNGTVAKTATIAAATTTGFVTTPAIGLVAGDILTCNVSGVGSTTAGANLTVLLTVVLTVTAS